MYIEGVTAVSEFDTKYGYSQWWLPKTV